VVLSTVFHTQYSKKMSRPNCGRMQGVLRATEECGVRDGDWVSTDVATREISSSHGGEYDVQSCLLGYTAV
jgi:hypothetical protein